MSVLLAEMTREQIRAAAPNAVAVLPTAAIEQHGPHLAILTDTLLCGTVAERAAQQAAERTQVLVAPVLIYGNSHHHRPFPGTLSLTSDTYMAAVHNVLEGLVLSGFRKLVVLNGHGGNTSANDVIGLDFVNRFDQPVSIATAAYWNIARPAIVDSRIMPGDQVPGHAGRFETSLVMALRPELVDHEALEQAENMRGKLGGLFAPLVGATVQTHGAWAAGTGYTDNPSTATAEDGKRMLDIIVKQVADFFVAFDQSTTAST